MSRRNGVRKSCPPDRTPKEAIATLVLVSNFAYGNHQVSVRRRGLSRTRHPLVAQQRWPQAVARRRQVEPERDGSGQRRSVFRHDLAVLLRESHRTKS